MSNLKSPIDWEFLQEPIFFNKDQISISESLNPTPSQISISRDKDYYIHIDIKGEGASLSNSFENRLKTKEGQSIFGEDIILRTRYDQEIITLHNLIINGWNSKDDGSFRLKSNSYKVSRKKTCEKTPTTTIVYALNCPDLSWSSSTKREYEGLLKVQSKFNSAKEKKSITYDYKSTTVNYSWNCLTLQNKYGTVIVTQAKDNVPSLAHLKPCTIHFIEGENKFESNFQKKWLEAIGFFFGERLIQVGTANICKDGTIIEQTSHNPYAQNLRNEIRNAGLPPFNVNDIHGTVDEARMSTAVEKFIDNYEELKLGDVVWRMWYGKMLPLGLNLVSYSSSLEALMNAWFRSSKTKSHGTYIDPKLYAEEITQIISSLKLKHSNDPSWSKIFKRIEGANTISISDKYAKLFQELGLDYGKVEEEVIKSRHKFAHGGSTNTLDGNYIVKAGRAYNTIIKRCVIKALGVSDHYYDYSEYGFPIRPIKDSLRGALGTYELLPKNS